MKKNNWYLKQDRRRNKNQVWKHMCFLLVFLFCLSIFAGCKENEEDTEIPVTLTPGNEQAQEITPVGSLTPTATVMPTVIVTNGGILTPNDIVTITNAITPEVTACVTGIATLTPEVALTSIATLTPEVNLTSIATPTPEVVLTEVVTPTPTATPYPTQKPRYGYSQNYEHPEFKCFTFCALDYDTEEVIDSENDYLSVSIASLTKMMTALTAFDVLKLDDMLATVEESYNIYNKDNQYVSLKSKLGETRSFEEWLNVMLLMSACDAAETIAYYGGGGSLEKFYEMMNAKAAELDLWASSFDNAVGADGALGYTNIGTSRDMAVLAKHFCENELFFKISQQTVYKTSKVVNRSSRNIFPSSKLSDKEFMEDIAARVVLNDLVERLAEAGIDFSELFAEPEATTGAEAANPEVKTDVEAANPEEKTDDEAAEPEEKTDDEAIELEVITSDETKEIESIEDIKTTGFEKYALDIIDGAFCNISIGYDENNICFLTDGEVKIQLFGLKTGFTDEAGRCYTFMAKRDDKKIVFAILGEAIGDEGFIDLYSDVVKMAWFYLN
ncbi:MAG: hypothetical protein MJ113_03305 [Lachnospiraceae bacterium]|nr:hypothetical protein [Lachnospiraceae bacterium]